MTTKTGSQRHTAGLFDVRNIIAALMGIYGVVLFIMGLVNFTEADKQRADNFNLNLWCGLGMFVFAVCMAAWAYLRPIVVDEQELAREKAAAEMENPNLHK
ncbi:hypothetical protein HJ588_13680 [Flexivirga sp. ID2601S]|uniref:Uncharacterized protein n=1 Tax=Flexivirga aerilata TaxID=1656889 RepID=A0A849AIP8_9MICO|nr:MULTISPECIES: hypothetical protein [Flexivirga]NNG40315.1 hypothetical protein [Flexivirga aerilata]